MICLIGASATGKTEVAKKIIEKYNYTKFVTTTTRPKREHEISDVDYHFISVSDFLKKIDNNEFIEYVKYADNYYGSTKNEVGDNKVIIVEPSGANVIHKVLGKEAVIFYLEASEDTRRKRMRFRNDKEEDIDKRLSNDREVFNIDNVVHIDFLINTDFLTVEEIADDIYSKYLEINNK